jgi:hypothetical protein
MKDLSKTTIVKELIDSLYSIKKNPFWLIMASLTDALFFLAWGFFTTPVRDKIVEHSVLVANQLSAIVAEQQGKIPTGILKHLIGPQLWPLTAKLLFLIFLLFIIIYLVYNAFHGTSWWMATNIAGEKWTYRQYVLGFAKINLLWITAFIIYKLLDVILGLRYLIIQKFAPGAPNIAGKMLFAALVLLVLAAFFGYPKLKTKTLFATPLRISIPLIILCTSIYLTAQFILNSIGKLSVDAALIAGLLLLFPTITLIKVYAIKVISHVHTRD